MKANRRVRLAAGVAALAMTAAACGDGSKSAMEDAADGRLTIGIKYDQPGLSQRNPDGTFSGFDIDVARYVAAKLGVEADGITFAEATTSKREQLIRDDKVDLVVASYSINERNKEYVDFAGPYFTAGQSLLVRKDDSAITGPESLKGGKRLCSVKGSTPARHLKDYYAKDVRLETFDTYSQCIDALYHGTIEAVTTDDLILAGFAAQAPDTLKLVGRPFTTERYGIGIKKGDNETRAKVNDAIETMYIDGSWERAFNKNVGKSGYPLPDPPEVDRY